MMMTTSTEDSFVLMFSSVDENELLTRGVHSRLGTDFAVLTSRLSDELLPVSSKSRPDGLEKRRPTNTDKRLHPCLLVLLVLLIRNGIFLQIPVRFGGVDAVVTIRGEGVDSTQ